LKLHDLASVALLGTKRSSLPVVSSTRAVETVLEKIKNEDTETSLLNMAGTLSLYEQAGHVSQKLQRVSHDLPNETVPRCSPKAANMLGKMLGGTFAEFLVEFLGALANSKQRIPEAFLPLLLDRARNVYNLRLLVSATLGETGRWLAKQNPSWYYAVQLDFDSAKYDWSSGQMLVRQGILRQARATNPNLGIALIESTWKVESPTDRAWILKYLRVNLSMRDEPFLEAALDDRSLTVRKLAAELLSALPESRLSKRMVAAMRSMVVREDNVLRLEIPEGLSSQLARDGVGRPMWNDPEKVRAAQLAEIVGLLSLSFWTSEGQTPEDIVTFAKDNGAFLSGLIAAAERQQNEAWAFALLKLDDNTPALKLFPILSKERMDAFVVDMRGEDKSVVSAFSRWSQPWTLTMCERWLEYLRHQEKLETTTETMLKYFARYCPASFIAPAISELTQLRQHSLWQKVTTEALLMLEFRKHMLSDLEVLT
jgi:hypothetical protein